MDLGLKGKRAIVTGGTRGIGRAIVDRLAAEGCHVALCARGTEEVAATVESVRSSGVDGYGKTVDVADSHALCDWIEEASTMLGGVDVLKTLELRGQTHYGSTNCGIYLGNPGLRILE